MAVVRRDRITKSGILISSLAIHAIVLMLMGVHTPTMRQWVSDAPPPPPFEVEIYELPPPPPPEVREDQAVAPPQSRPEPVEMRPRELPPEPEPKPAPTPRPEPTPEPIRQPEPIPAPPRPQPQPQPKKKEEREATPRPSPVQPREVAKEAPPAPMAPLPMAPVSKPAAPGGPATAGRSGGGSPLPDFGVKPGGDLRDALRRSSVGCANDTAVGLNRRENENCRERMGAGAKDADFIQAPIGAKREAFDAAAARKDRDRAWKAAPVPAGIDSRANAGGGQPVGLGDDR